MFSPLLLLALVSAAMACASTVPPQRYAPPPHRHQPLPGQPLRPRPITHNKQEVVWTIVVSTHNYDPATNHQYLKVFQSKFNAYVRGRGMGNGYGLSIESVRNVNGKFGVEYGFIGVKCDQVKQFLVDMKKATDFINHIHMRCKGRGEFDAY